MICPKDKSAMVVVGYEDVELDYCTECRGVWFDSGELEQLFDSIKLDITVFNGGSILDLPEAKTDEKARRCPICDRRMKKVNIGQPPILIDACGSDHGLWFDGGEMAQLATQRTPKPDAPQEKVINFLGEIFKADS